MTALSPDMTKPELRAAMRMARKAHVAGMSADERYAASEALCSALAPLLAEAQIVGLYSAVGSEMPVDAVERWLTDNRKIIAFPRMRIKDAGFHFAIGPCNDMGPQGIDQPAEDAPTMSPDLILVPLLAVDVRGTRLGQGGGHYDRSLEQYGGARLIGVGWPRQKLTMDLPIEPWDVPLHGFASENGLEIFAR